MLRRRILASAMASVMALGSVAVVANAEETAAATKQVKTKADLEAYVKEFDKFATDGVNDYGSVSGEQFLNALEYANNVLDNEKSTVDDYTVAYSMLEAVYNKLTIYTSEQLATLIKSCKTIYDQNNVYNEELNDAVYTTGSWDSFEKAYDDAVSVQKSSDSRVITDYYEALDAAKSALSPLATATKSEFRKVLKEYESLLQKEFAYDSWRLGKIDGWNTVRVLLNDADGNKPLGDWGFYGQTVAYGTLYQWAKTFDDVINNAYDQMDIIKAVNKTSDPKIVEGFQIAQDIVDIFKCFKADEDARASKATVTKLLDKYHGRLVHDYATTAAQDLYDMVVEAVGETKIHNRLADNDYSSSIDEKASAVTSDAAWYVQKAVFKHYDDQNVDYKKDVDAQLSIKTDVAFYMIKNADGDVVSVTTTKPAASDKKEFYTVRAKSEVDLTDYIQLKASDIKNEWSPVDNHNINGINDGDNWGGSVSYDGVSGLADTTWSGFQNWSTEYSYNHYAPAFGGDYQNSEGEWVKSYTNLATAMKYALIYVGGDKAEIAASGIEDELDTIGAIKEGSAKGSSAEWALVYRYLKYALSDKYDVSVGTHTKAEVEELIDKSYELAELTGDAALFTVNHTELVKARQDALAWVKAANKDKTYSDNTITYNIDNGNGKIAGYKVADQVYTELKNYYDALEKDYNAFKYSFSEIYNTIADTKTAIDEGELKATDDVVAALEATAYRLSVVSDITVDASDNQIYLDNDAYTSDRIFNGFNRVYTNTGDAYELKTEKGTVKIPGYKANGEVTSHALLAEAYDALVAAVKAQTEPTVVLGDVDGNGVVNALDASAILKAVVAGTEIDVKVGDFDQNGTVNALDASAILKFVVSQG